MPNIIDSTNGSDLAILQGISKPTFYSDPVTALSGFILVEAKVKVTNPSNAKRIIVFLQLHESGTGPVSGFYRLDIDAGQSKELDFGGPIVRNPGAAVPNWVYFIQTQSIIGDGVIKVGDARILLAEVVA